MKVCPPPQIKTQLRHWLLPVTCGKDKKQIAYCYEERDEDAHCGDRVKTNDRAGNAETELVAHHQLNVGKETIQACRN